MPKVPRMPRVYLVRHSETEWSLSGQHTGVTDIPLTENGERKVVKLRQDVVGIDKLLCPRTISHIFLSPRQRAQRTYELLFEHVEKNSLTSSIETTDQVQEWNYGTYEGLTSPEIRKLPGCENWDIFEDGCPNGESPQQMQGRVDTMIQEVTSIHQKYWNRVSGIHGKSVDDEEPGADVLIVTHGHFSKSFLARWAQLPLKVGAVLNVDAGGISVCGYQHRTLKEPSLLGLNMYSL